MTALACPRCQHQIADIPVSRSTTALRCPGCETQLLLFGGRLVASGRKSAPPRPQTGSTLPLNVSALQPPAPTRAGTPAGGIPATPTTPPASAAGAASPGARGRADVAAPSASASILGGSRSALASAGTTPASDTRSAPGASAGTPSAPLSTTRPEAPLEGASAAPAPAPRLIYKVAPAETSEPGTLVDPTSWFSDSDDAGDTLRDPEVSGAPAATAAMGGGSAPRPGPGATPPVTGATPARPAAPAPSRPTGATPARLAEPPRPTGATPPGARPTAASGAGTPAAPSASPPLGARLTPPSHGTKDIAPARPGAATPLVSFTAPAPTRSPIGAGPATPAPPLSGATSPPARSHSPAVDPSPGGAPTKTSEGPLAFSDLLARAGQAGAGGAATPPAPSATPPLAGLFDEANLSAPPTEPPALHATPPPAAREPAAGAHERQRPAVTGGGTSKRLADKPAAKGPKKPLTRRVEFWAAVAAVPLVALLAVLVMALSGDEATKQGHHAGELPADTSKDHTVPKLERLAPAPAPEPEPRPTRAAVAPSPPPVDPPRAASASDDDGADTKRRRRRGKTLGGKPVVLEYDQGSGIDGPLPWGADPKTLARARTAYQTGNRRLFSGDTDGAIRAYRQSLRIYPGYVAGYRGLGLAYMQAKDDKNALKALRIYVRTVPSARDVRLIRKRIERLEGR